VTVGQKPEIKIAVKDVESKAVTSLFAFWREADGKLSGRLDGRVKALKVLLDDDSVVLVKRLDERKTSHFVNCYENGPAAPSGYGQRDTKPANNDGAWAGRGGNDDAGGGFADNFGDDDQIPFDRLRGEVEW
jgi:hypothetical protein